MFCYWITDMIFNDRMLLQWDIYEMNGKYSLYVRDIYALFKLNNGQIHRKSTNLVGLELNNLSLTLYQMSYQFMTNHELEVSQ